MKEFDLNAAKMGEPIVTRGGDAAKFIAHVPEAYAAYQVVVLARGAISSHNTSGHFYSESDPSSGDLFMASRKRTVWVNLYQPHETANYYEHEQSADEYASTSRIGNRAWPLEIED